MKSSTASPRNSSRSLSSSALAFSFMYERWVNARESSDRLVNERPRRLAISAGDSGKPTSDCATTGTSPELRERHALSPAPLARDGSACAMGEGRMRKLRSISSKLIFHPILSQNIRGRHKEDDILRYNHANFSEEFLEQ